MTARSLQISKKGDGLAHDNIRHIVQDKNGNLWFGSADGGVSKYNGKTFTTFNETHGLSNDRITSMLVDKTGNLWIGTARGLNKLGKDK